MCIIPREKALLQSPSHMVGLELRDILRFLNEAIKVTIPHGGLRTGLDIGFGQVKVVVESPSHTVGLEQ